MKRLTALAAILMAVVLTGTGFAQHGEYPPEGMRRFGDKHSKMEKMRDRMEKMEAYMDDLSEYDPEIKDLFDQVKESTSKRSRRFLHQLAREGRYVMAVDHPDSGSDLKNLFTQYIKLELNTIILSDQIASAPQQGDAEALNAQLRDMVSQSFDIKQQLRAQRLVFLERKLEKTKEQLEYRASNRDKIIEQRLQSLLSTEEQIEW
ncbi:MAG: hypothetical protein RBU23_00175 [Candidatus Auribacterota bacterium]|jgi:hypothetical protein|nr:hypothetical protein [Candidatus Auribacterota bacterium]